MLFPLPVVVKQNTNCHFYVYLLLNVFYSGKNIQRIFFCFLIVF